MAAICKGSGRFPQLKHPGNALTSLSSLDVGSWSVVLVPGSASQSFLGVNRAFCLIPVLDLPFLIFVFLYSIFFNLWMNFTLDQAYLTEFQPLNCPQSSSLAGKGNYKASVNQVES